MNDGEQKRTNAHALSGIRTPGLSVQAIKVYASECAATGTSVIGYMAVNSVFQH